MTRSRNYSNSVHFATQDLRSLPVEKAQALFPEAGLTEDVYVLTAAEIKMLQERSALSGLPGNTEIKKEIVNSFINGPPHQLIAYIDLSGFKAYNDNYGFVRGDKVLETIAHKFREANPGFSGHIGGDDFVAIMCEEDFDVFIDELLTFFETKLRDFYDEVDYERGCIVSFDRDGNRSTFPLMGCTIVAFKNQARFNSPESVGEYAAQLKNVAKLKANYYLGNSIVFKTSGDDITPLKAMIIDKSIPLNIRRGAIESLGEIKDFSYENTILEVLHSQEVELFIKKSALFALGKLRLKETIPEIKEFLQHQSPHLRMRAVEALGEIGVPDDGIVQAFNDKNFYVRKAAVMAAGRTNDAKYISALKQKLADKDLRSSAFISLAALGDQETIGSLANYAKAEAIEIEMRITALKIMSDNEEKLQPADIQTILNDIEQEPPAFIVEALLVSAKALTRLESLFAAQELNRYLQLAEHEHWRVRRAVCEFAYRAGGEAAEKTVEKLCHDTSASVQIKAVESLRGFPRKYYFISKFFTNRYAAIRAAAVSGIREMDIPDNRLPGIVEKLRVRLKDSSHKVAESAAQSILSLLRKKVIGEKSNGLK